MKVRQRAALKRYIRHKLATDEEWARHMLKEAYELRSNLTRYYPRFGHDTNKIRYPKKFSTPYSFTELELSIGSDFHERAVMCWKIVYSCITFSAYKDLYAQVKTEAWREGFFDNQAALIGAVEGIADLV